MVIRSIARLVALIEVFVVCAAPADARKKTEGFTQVRCTCTCASDQKGQGGLPLHFESVSFDDDAISCLYASGFGGCRIKVGNKYVSGTLQNCDMTPNTPSSRDNAGADPGGGALPTAPFSRPGKLFLPNP